ncbi:transposase [Candidatus Aalborgicola defluviihabitans]|uniref:transposase n=1 Tax=Candidatus Aalborgicola defluviihabitans TaxID=3386187 RepID=UPI0039B860A6
MGNASKAQSNRTTDVVVRSPALCPSPKDTANPSERMRQAIDSPKGRQLYSQRFGTVEPVFANIRHNKRLTRLNHRGRTKVNHPVEPVLHGAQH